MKRFAVIIASLFATIGLLRAESKPVTLTLSKEITWKDFFDGGYRPHHVMDGITNCREFDVQLTLYREGYSRPFKMNPGNASFYIAKDYLVVKFRHDTSANLSFKEAQAKLDQFQKMFADKIRPGGKGVLVFNEAHNRYDHKKAFTLVDFGDWTIGYSLTPSYQEIQLPQPPRSEWKPFIERLAITYRGDSRMIVARLDKPIEPPPGYGDVSMKEPEIFHAREPESPSSTLKTPPRFQFPSNERPVKRGAKEGVATARKFPWFLSVCIFVALGVCGYAIWRRMKING